MTEQAPAPLTIPGLVRLAGENSEAHGFHDDRPGQDGNYPGLDHDLDTWRGNRLMLIVGEVAEAHEEVRDGNGTTSYYTDSEGERWDNQVHPEDGEPLRKPEGLPSELADIVIRAGDMAYTEGIDLEAAIREKMEYNATRPHKHGKQF